MCSQEFDTCKETLIERGTQFAHMSMKSRQKIAEFGERFIQDGMVRARVLCASATSSKLCFTPACFPGAFADRLGPRALARRDAAAAARECARQVLLGGGDRRKAAERRVRAPATRPARWSLVLSGGAAARSWRLSWSRRAFPCR